MAYTYEDFEKAASAAGLLGNFSSYDLDLARRYPEAGLSLLSLKRDYQNATTDEQRVLANEGANQIRSSYGGYTAGKNGSGYVSDGKLAGQIGETLDRIGSFGSFRYGRENEYQAALDAVQGREPFEYDYTQDPSWQAYKKEYTREGQRALQDTMGQYAAMTGGMPSSAALIAGQQANNYYMAQLSDKLPELYQAAYQRYAQEYQDRMNALDALLADRKQAQSEYLSEQQLLQSYLGALQGQEETAYTRAWNEAQAKQAAEQQALENRLGLAQLGAGYGDYGGLAALGITPDYQNVLDQALAAAGRTVPVGSGGKGSGGTTGTGDTDPVAPGGIDAGLLAQLKTAYPDGKVTSANDWNYLLSKYDEATLNAAGYRYAGGEKDTGAEGEISDLSQLGSKAYNLLNQMARSSSGRNAGYFAEQIQSGLDDGSITEAEADYLMRAFGY